MAKKFPLHPKHPERICWGCDKYCSTDNLQCGNGSSRTQHPMELLGEDGHPIQVTASFGIAASSPDMRPQQLLTQADKALYEAKACGRNSVRAYLAQAVRPAAGI